MVRPVHLLPNLEHVARRVRRDHRGVLASRSIRNASELAAARVTLMADWRGMGEPPIDPPDNEQEGSDLEVLRSAGTSPLDPHELSYAVTQLFMAHQRQFQEDLSVQLEQLCDTSLRPIDRGDPRWATMIKVATALVRRGVRI